MISRSRSALRACEAQGILVRDDGQPMEYLGQHARILRLLWDQVCWTPPGGFVEAGESLEAAAVREVREEVRVKLDPRQLTPSAMISLPAINQIHCGFIARLPGRVEAEAVLPETLEVGWFTEDEMRAMENWDPAARIDVGVQFEFFRSSAFQFIQQTDGFLRLIAADGIRYL